MGKQVMRIENVKNIQGITTRYRHNVRIEEEKGTHINSELTQNNVELIKLSPETATPAAFFKKRISELEYYKTHDIRKNAVLCNEVMLAYGLDDLPENFSVAKWAKESQKFLEDTFGKENIISAVVHMDESSPHIHALVMPIKNGKLSARAVIGDRDGLRDIHERYYEDYMKECGLEPEDTGKSGLDRENMVHYHRGRERALEKTLPQKGLDESDFAYWNRMNQIYKDQMLTNFELQKRNELLARDNKALRRSAAYREEKDKKEYNEYAKALKTSHEYEIQKIVEHVGGDIDAAAEAVREKELLDEKLKYMDEHYPEKAEKIRNNLLEMDTIYQDEVLELQPEQMQK